MGVWGVVGRPSFGRAVLVAFVFLVACGGGDGPSGPGDGSGEGTFGATVNGQAWSADPRFVTVTAGGTAQPGSLILSGTDFQSSTSYRTLLLTLSFLEGPGTYPLGVNVGTTGGGVGQVVVVNGGSTQSWLTPLSGNAGTVTITSLTGSRVVGTFSYTADARRRPRSGARPGTAPRATGAGSRDPSRAR